MVKNTQNSIHVVYCWPLLWVGVQVLVEGDFSELYRWWPQRIGIHRILVLQTHGYFLCISKSCSELSMPLTRPLMVQTTLRRGSILVPFKSFKKKSLNGECCFLEHLIRSLTNFSRLFYTYAYLETTTEAITRFLKAPTNLNFKNC